MLAKLLRPVIIGYVQILEGATLRVISQGDLETKVSYMDYTFTIPNEDLKVWE